ncbi:triose-phosphate isomerase [Candidatus Woesearchaeota archaeon]|nr:triose-phosphate isomerase [Candidatus Woesearchaeota archaeon]
MKKTIIAGNWKMNKTLKESISFVKELKGLIEGIEDKEIIIFPPFTSLAAVKEEIGESDIRLGAQNMHFEESGAFTGEVSPLMLKDTGVEYVILGHSERRHVFGEDDGMINKKVISALSKGLKPILCVGEKLEQREQGKTHDIIRQQLEKGVLSLKKEQLKDMAIAYEPVWAIGTGKTATPAQAEEVHAFIRKILEELFDSSASNGTPVLYGGSVKPGNIKELISQENIGGVLVGGASLDPKNFSEMIRCR